MDQEEIQATEESQSTEESQPMRNWGQILVEELLHPFVIIGAPLLITLLLVYLLVLAFRNNLEHGFRSSAAVLLPLVLSTFVLVFRKELLQRLGKIPVLAGFAIFGMLGFFLLFIVRLLSDLPAIPIAELVLSGSLSVLVFGYASLPANRILSLFYGIVAGFLFHIVVLGWPL